MIIIGYVGDHKKDTLATRLGWALVRLAQVGDLYHKVTHCEALWSGSWRQAVIEGASVRDGGVRIKVVDLTPGHWIVLDVPAWDQTRAMMFVRAKRAAPYDWRGALATVLWLLPGSKTAWFCSELLAAAAGLLDPQRYKPSTLFALAASLPGTRDITAEFFSP